MHVLIVGAGLGGLTLAQTLRKQNISFQIFERDTDRNSRFQGWAIALHTITDEIVSSMPSDMPDLKEATNHLAPLDLPAQILMYYPEQDRMGFVDSSETPLIRAERYRLREWLSTNIPIQWGKRLESVENDDSGVTVWFEDGTSAKGDMLVGADGIQSIVRQNLLHRSHDDLLEVVPLANIVGQLTLSGDAFKRQLALGHSSYSVIRPELGFITFVGLHDVSADGQSARFYWMMMHPDATVGSPGHWLQTASKQAKLDHVLRTAERLSPDLREIFELTPVEGIREEKHIWRDLELSSLPAGRVVLLGDAAHAMTPFKGEGGYHAFLDALALSRLFGKLGADGGVPSLGAIRTAVEAYNTDMLRRSGESVRSSRVSYDEAKKKVEKRQAFLAPMKMIPKTEISLDARG
ncbi:FAD/NAD(P)-binding domain-containing protein [Nemania diffusa]|nr:FAD/NAD(P)-binding domain-containing protein [Nemania diffusa]